jgi:hypothetical protein
MYVWVNYYDSEQNDHVEIDAVKYVVVIDWEIDVVGSYGHYHDRVATINMVEHYDDALDDLRQWNVRDEKGSLRSHVQRMMDWNAIDSISHWVWYYYYSDCVFEMDVMVHDEWYIVEEEEKKDDNKNEK